MTEEQPQDTQPKQRRRRNASAAGDWKDVMELAGLIQSLPVGQRAVVKEVIKAIAGMEKPRRRRKPQDALQP